MPKTLKRLPLTEVTFSVTGKGTYRIIGLYFGTGVMVWLRWRDVDRFVKWWNKKAKP